MLSFHPSELKQVFEELARLGSTEITSKTFYDGGAISLHDLFSSLTRLQAQAFIEALDAGYYAVPRKITIGRIAEGRRVARTTYSKHFRKAENKIVQAVAPYVRLYAATKA